MGSTMKWIMGCILIVAVALAMQVASYPSYDDVTDLVELGDISTLLSEDDEALPAPKTSKTTGKMKGSKTIPKAAGTNITAADKRKAQKKVDKRKKKKAVKKATKKA